MRPKQAEKDERPKPRGASKVLERVRGFLSSRVFLALAAILGVYTLAGFFLIPHVLERQAGRYVNDTLGRQVRMDDVRINPYALTLEIDGFSLMEADGSKLLAFDRLHVNLQGVSLFKWAWTFKEVRLQAPFAHLQVFADGSSNLARLIEDAGAGSKAEEGDGPAKTPEPPPRMVFQAVRIHQGAFAFTDRTTGKPVRKDVRPINLSIEGLSTLPDREAPHVFSAVLPGGGTLDWEGRVSLHPIGSQGTVRVEGFGPGSVWDLFEEALNIENPGGALFLEARYRFVYEDQHPHLQVDPIRARLEGLAIAFQGRPDPSLEIGEISVEGGRFDSDGNRLSLGKVRVADGRVGAWVDEQGNLDWSGLLEASGGSPPVSKPGTPPPFLADLETLSVEGLAVRLVDESRAEPLHLDLDRFDLALSAAYEQGRGPIRFTADNIRAGVRGLRLKGQLDSEPAVRVEDASLRDARFSLGERSLHIGGVALSGVRADVIREQDGAINISRLLLGRDRETSTEVDSARQGGVRSGVSPWSVALDSFRIRESAVLLSDLESGAPGLYRLDRLRLDLTNVTTHAETPVNVDLALDVEGSGSVSAAGRLLWQKPRLEAGISVQGIPLGPLQPYLDQAARLSLDSGAFSAEGDLLYDPSGSSKGSFRGSASVEDLLLTLPQSGKRFLSWTSIAAQGMDLTLDPGGAVVEEVVLVEPAGELIIQEDGRVNMQGVLRPGEDSVERPVPEPPEGSGRVSEAGAFPVDVKRVKVQNGTLDFADLSLQPDFATRIHDLTGLIVGLSNRTGRRAGLELDGRVDAYGSTRIRGELDLADTKRYSDVSMRFENVDMTRISPYSGKFAGYRIHSGKLSLDLRYEVKDRMLEGENRIVLDRLTLGERVDSPDALDVPLELALALLRDSKGRIDIDLPVSGDLDDPEFSYGHLIWRALGTFFTKIVTAPFRALASMLGLEGEHMDTVWFEPGRSSVSPPEREKLQALADALRERPRIAVEIEGAYDPELDGRFLRSETVRRDVALRSGVTLTPGEDPGPVNLTDPETRGVLADLGLERLGPEAVRALEREHGLSAPGEGEDPESPPEATAEPPAVPPDEAGFYQGLLNRLVERAVPEGGKLEALGQERADAVADVLADALGGTEHHRLRKGGSVAARRAAEGLIACKLDMEPLKDSSGPSKNTGRTGERATR